ncbi:LysM peptidoglycan-binding domain-containing protein [Actinoplanes sp. CA-054009]
MALAAFGGNPFPRRLGSAQEIWASLSQQDDGHLFLGAVLVVGWLAWISFAVPAVLEIVARLSGRRAWRIPLLRGQQRWAAMLVTSVALMSPAPAMASTSAAPMHSAAPLVPAVAALNSGLDASTTASRAAPQARDRIHVVQRGEMLLDLAERYGVPYDAIAYANHGVVQADGRTLHPGQGRLYPGWQMRIPPTTAAARTTAITPVADLTSAAPATRMVYQVKRGDWLWFIAERYLGDAKRYPEIAALNPDLITAASGMNGPSHIQGGWKLILPADAHDRGPRDHARGTTSAPQRPPRETTPSPNPPADNGGNSEGQSSSRSPTASPTTPPPSPGAAPATPSPTSAAPSTAAPSNALTPTRDAASAPSANHQQTASGGPEPASDGNETALYASLAGAGLLSALVLGAVLKRRRGQQQHRRPQRRLPHPRGGATETALRVAEQPADVDRLDTALRALAVDLAHHDQPELPDIIGAWIAGGTIHLILAGPCARPPAAWIDEGTQWTLPASAPLPDVDGNVAPLPALVAVGHQSGRHLLLDLERLGSISIGGDEARARNVLRYIASELACNSWSDDVEVILAGFGQDESELLVDLNPDRVRAVSSVSEAVARLRRRVAAATTTLRHVGASDALAGRLGDLAGDAWMPQVLLVADVDEHDRGALGRLTGDLAVAGRCTVAVAAIGLAPVTPRSADVDLIVAADGILHVTAQPLDVSVSAAGLPAKELEPLAEIMRQARARADEPVPPASETESWAAGTDAAGGMLGLFARDPARTPRPEPHIQVETERGATASGDGTASTEKPVRSPGAPIVSIDPWSAESVAAEPPGTVTADGAAAITVASLAPTGSRRQVTAAIRQRRRQADPHLDRDLQSWNEQDPSLVRVGVLGPVTVAAPGEEPTERQRFLTEIIVFLAQRAARGATADKLSDALWPEGNVKDASRRVAITRARRWLGTTPTADPWLPDMGADRTYRLADGYLLDWHLFRRLRSRGETHGPAGIKDLRAALELVRGVPFDGADRAYAAGTRNPYTWLPESEIYPGHLVSAIVDTAHELAEMYLDAGDTTNARWTVQRAWLADPYRGDDELWRDIMRAEHLDGHNAQLRQLLGALMQARDAEVPEDLAKSTYAWLRTALPDVLEPNIGSSI